MIIQCDQCKTRFRLDDSRVTVAGVRVRCSRCKHTFVVKKDAHEDGADITEVMCGLKSSFEETPKQDDTAGDVVKTQNGSVWEDEEVKRLHETVPDWREGFSSENAADDSHAVEGDPRHLAGVGLDNNTVPAVEESAEEKPSMRWAMESEAETHQRQKVDSFDVPVKETEEEKETIPSGAEDFLKDFEKTDFGGNYAETAAVEEFVINDPDHADQPKSGSDRSWEIFPTSDDSGAEAHKDAETDGLVVGNAQNGEAEEYFHLGDDDPGVIAHVADAGAVSRATDFAEGPEEKEAKGKEQGIRDLFDVATSGAKDTMPRQAGDAAGVTEEDLPPLAVTSRRKKSLSISVVLAGIILIVLLVGVVGLFSPRIDFSTLNIPGLTALSSRLATGKAKNAEITIRYLDGSFVRNNRDGEVFVVRGEALNQSTKALSSIRIQGYIYGSKGEVLMKNPAYFGNNLSNDQLIALSVNEIEVFLKNQSGNFSRDMVVQPGKGIPFQIIFTNVAQGAGEFGAEVIGATPVAP